MRKILYIICISLSLVALSCDKDVTDYRRITIALSQPHEHYGITTYSDPKFEIENLKHYLSDSLAIEDQKAWAKDAVKFFSKKLESLLQENPESEMDKLKLNVQIEAMQELLAQSYYLISFTHKESFDAAELFNFMKEYGIDSKETNEYIKDNELQVNIYPISGF